MIAILIVNLRRSTTGLALNAVRWSENASRTMGLSVIQMKMLVSGLAAFVAGVGGGLYAVGHKQAIPLDYATLAGLVWLAVLVTFGVRSNIAALLAGCVFALSPAFVQTVPATELHLGAAPDPALRSRCRLRRPEPGGHRAPAGNGSPAGCIHRVGGARAVPAATAYAGRHDPRLHRRHDRTDSRTGGADGGGHAVMSAVDATEPAADAGGRRDARRSRRAT